MQYASAIALLLASGVTHADIGLDASLAAFADSESGSSFDIDASISPRDWLTLGVGLGRSESADDRASLEGDAFRASAGVHSNRFGLRGYFRKWSDSGEFESETLGARAYLNHERFTFELIAEAVSLGVDFALTQGNRSLEVHREFDGTGFGASLSYFGARWSGYAEAVTYDYDRVLEQIITISRGPNVARFPRFQFLIDSVLTLTQGALDYHISGGVERSLGRSAILLDVLSAKDAVDGRQTHSVSAGYRYSLSRHVDFEVTLGASDTDELGSIGFGGLTLSLHR